MARGQLTLWWLKHRSACGEACEQFETRFGRRAPVAEVARALADPALPKGVGWWHWLLNQEGPSVRNPIARPIREAYLTAAEEATKVYLAGIDAAWKKHPRSAVRRGRAVQRVGKARDAALRQAILAAADSLAALFAPDARPNSEPRRAPSVPA